MLRPSHENLVWQYLFVNPKHMKQDTIAKIVRATIAEYLDQSNNRIAEYPLPIEKYFVWIDLTFRREESIKISSRRILKKWDLYEINLKNGQTLGNYLRTCNVGDVFKSKIDMLECLSMN